MLRVNPLCRAVLGTRLMSEQRSEMGTVEVVVEVRHQGHVRVLCGLNGSNKWLRL